MSMNIKSQNTHRRAKELARLAGETMAEAVDKAVLERLERIRKGRNIEALSARLLEIGRLCRTLPIRDTRSPEAMLFDEYGLPK